MVHLTLSFINISRFKINQNIKCVITYYIHFISLLHSADDKISEVHADILRREGNPQKLHKFWNEHVARHDQVAQPGKVPQPLAHDEKFIFLTEHGVALLTEGDAAYHVARHAGVQFAHFHGLAIGFLFQRVGEIYTAICQ